MTKKIDWQKISEWDNKYIVKCYATEQEYATIPIESTEGDYLIMPDGTRLLDFYNQLFCVNIGQKIPEVQEAIAEALARYGFIWDIYTSDYKAEVAKLIIEDILGEYDWPGQIRFTLGGGDSVEIATMLARLVTGKTMIATREHSYHGVSGVATSLTRLYPGRSHLCAGSSDMLRQVPGATYQGSVMCPAPFCYRCPLGHDYPACKGVYTDGMLPCVKQTEQIIRTYGADNFAAIITEPAFGAGSIVSPAMEYLTQIYEMKQRLGILWIMDEVMMGFGRLGEWFGYQKYDKNIRPDLVTMAKGITSSALPLGAVLISQDVAAVLKKTRWNHVSTFSGHPVVLAAAKANLQYMIKHNIPALAKKSGEYFEAGLLRLADKYPCIGYVGGGGMFWEVELVRDKKTREPFIDEDRYTSFSGDCSHYPSKIIAKKCMEKGVLLGGYAPNTLRIGASLTVSEADMDKALDALDYALAYLCTLI